MQDLPRRARASSHARMRHKMIVFAAAAGLAHSASAGFAPFASRIQQLQESMVKQAKSADPTATWTVDEHSRGKACIIEDGEIWEKGCISVTLMLPSPSFGK